jgi:hypothetical protein
MEPTEFRSAVEEDAATELERLGSQQLLLALTDADLDREPVLAAAANAEHRARETFEGWADDERDAQAQAAFEREADREREHFERVVDLLDGEFEPSDELDAMHAHLRDIEDTIPRVAAGLVGRSLVGTRTHLQFVSFFVNEADEVTADVFRDLRAETGETLEVGLELLGELCETEAGWTRAQEATVLVVQVAYEEYAESLTSMGLDPKPIC